jgi:hypothetical protein
MSGSIAEETETLIKAQRFAETQQEAALRPLFHELGGLYELLGRSHALSQAARDATLDRYTEVQVAIHREMAGWGEKAGAVRTILYDRLMATVNSIDLVARFSALREPGKDVGEDESLRAFLRLQQEAREWWMSYEEQRALWRTELLGFGTESVEG